MITRISYRRSLLDHLLNQRRSQMLGVVVDIGGEKKNQRGSFRPPDDTTENHWYLINISQDVAPTIYGDAHFLPLPDNSVDCVLCCEVLEHIEDPRKVCLEIYRILKPGGVAFISTPFLFPIHADPNDYQRFTPSGLKYLTSNFVSVRIDPMGGTLGTLGELIIQAGNSIKKHSLIRKIVKLIGIIMVKVEKSIGTAQFHDAFSTGYFVEAYKP